MGFFCALRKKRHALTLTRAALVSSLPSRMPAKGGKDELLPGQRKMLMAKMHIIKLQSKKVSISYRGALGKMCGLILTPRGCN